MHTQPTILYRPRHRALLLATLLSTLLLSGCWLKGAKEKIIPESYTATPAPLVIEKGSSGHLELSGRCSDFDCEGSLVKVWVTGLPASVGQVEGTTVLGATTMLPVSEGTPAVYPLVYESLGEYVLNPRFLRITPAADAVPGTYQIEIHVLSKRLFRLSANLVIQGTPPGSLPLTLELEGAGRVTSASLGVDCLGPSTCNANVPPRSIFDLTATPSPGFFFAGWSGDINCATGATLSGATVCTARFRPLRIELEVIVQGEGGVLISPPGENCLATCRSSFDGGTTVRLTATPNTGNRVRWQGSGACSGTAASIELTMDRDQSCTARFERALLLPTGWSSLGNVESGGNFQSSPAVQFSNLTGLPVVAYVHATGSDAGQLKVSRYDGTAWTRVGDTINTTGFGIQGGISLVLINGTDPVVAWTGTDGRVRVSRWDFNQWVALPDPTIAASNPLAINVQLELHQYDLVAAWSEYEGGTARLAVRHFDLLQNDRWTGGYLPNIGSPTSLLPRVAMNAGNRPMVIYQRFATTGSGGELPLRASEETASAWQPLCNDLDTTGGSATPSYANQSVGFGITFRAGGTARAFATSPDRRSLLAFDCVGGAWQPYIGLPQGRVFQVTAATEQFDSARLKLDFGDATPTLVYLVANAVSPANRTTEMGFLRLRDIGSTLSPVNQIAALPVFGRMDADAFGAGAVGIAAVLDRGGNHTLEVWTYGP